MHEREKRKLARQLKMQAEAMEKEDDSGQLAVSMLATCNSLLKTVTFEEVESLSETDFGMLEAGYMSAAMNIIAFYKENEKSKEEERKPIAFELKEKTEELEEYKQEHTELKQSIWKLDREIELIPKENQELLRTYQEKETILEKLKEAKEECSQEKQAALQKEIEELTPIVEELQSNFDILRERKMVLDQRQIHYDRERQKLSTNVLDMLQGSMSELEQVMKEHESILKDIKKTADILSDNLQNCNKMRKEYSDWFETSKTPLEAMILSVNRPEFSELRKTLNVGEIKTVKKLFQETSHNINQLDQILEKCIAAARIDQKKLERRTRP